MSAYVNETVRLSCAAGGFPTPLITWTASGRNLSAEAASMNGCPTLFTENRTINSTEVPVSVLELCPLNTTDAGEYRCSADNGLSSSFTSTNLSVLGECVNHRNFKEKLIIYFDVSASTAIAEQWQHDH